MWSHRKATPLNDWEHFWMPIQSVRSLSYRATLTVTSNLFLRLKARNKYCEFSLLDGLYSPYRVLICFRPASRIAWPRRPHRSYLSLASSRRSTPSLSITKPFMQISRISHPWLAAYHLAKKSDRQYPDGLQTASRYCLTRNDEMSKMKTHSMPIITCNQKRRNQPNLTYQFLCIYWRSLLRVSGIVTWWHENTEYC